MKNVTLLGAGMAKWTTPNPCLSSSSSDSKVFTNFEFCDEKIHKHL